MSDDVTEQLVENEDYIVIDEATRREALDRCLMISDILNAHLLEHPFIQTNEKLLDKVQDVFDELLEVYEEIAEVEVTEGTKFMFEEIEIDVLGDEATDTEVESEKA